MKTRTANVQMENVLNSQPMATASNPISVP